MEIADYATYDGSTVMFDVMGFGRRSMRRQCCCSPACWMAWGTTIRPGRRLRHRGRRDQGDGIRIPAPRCFDVAAGHIPKGGQAALRFEILGMVKGKPAIVIDQVTRLREDLRPEWPQPAQPGGSYKVEIVGEPSYTVDICSTSRRGDHNYAAIAAGAGGGQRDPWAVVAAPPGIRTTMDLPLITGKGLLDANRAPDNDKGEHRMGRVDGKVALISGGARGMGPRMRGCSSTRAARS